MENPKLLEHKHLIVRALINKPPTNEDDMRKWIKRLTDAIDMKIMIGPFAVYSEMTGNRGITAGAVIETSHIMCHVWDEVSPALLEFDLYTCGSLNVPKVLTMLDEFEPMEVTYMVLDREYDLTGIGQGKYINGGKK